MKQRSLFSKPKVEPPVTKPIKNKPVARSEVKNYSGKNDRFTQPFLDKMKLKDPEEIKIYEDIQRHRLQLLLVELQARYPEISKIVAYAEEFKDWDASTGFHLPLNDPWVCWKAQQVLKKR